MGTVKFELEAVVEMRREAALEMERIFAASKEPEPKVLWVVAGVPVSNLVAGVPVSNIEAAHLTIGQVSEGHPVIHLRGCLRARRRVADDVSEARIM